MAFQAIVLYANDADTKFDLDYYLASHMPFVQETWGKHGLTSWDVLKFGPGPDGSQPPYHIQATLKFTSGAAMQQAMNDERTKDIFEDVPKFTNKQPVFMAGDVVGSV